MPWPDMGDAMREAGIPLLSLEGAAPVASFDIVGLHVPHEMAVTNFLEALGPRWHSAVSGRPR